VFFSQINQSARSALKVDADQPNLTYQIQFEPQLLRCGFFRKAKVELLRVLRFLSLSSG
jgi:hypothetical protein